MGRFLYPDASWISPTAIRFLKGLTICPTGRQETGTEIQDPQEIMTVEAETGTDVRVAGDEAEIVTDDPVAADEIEEIGKEYRGDFYIGNYVARRPIRRGLLIYLLKSRQMNCRTTISSSPQHAYAEVGANSRRKIAPVKY